LYDIDDKSKDCAKLGATITEDKGFYL